MRAIPLSTLALVALLLLPSVPLNPAGDASAGTGTPTFAIYAAPSTMTPADGATEPSIGVNWKTGAVMYQANSNTWKIVFNDATVPASATWSDVSAGILVNIDPILFTDSSVGRTYAGGLATVCSDMLYTDNDGASWTQMGNDCAGQDHESVGAGAWHGSPPLLASGARAVYYCAQNGSIYCTTSSDGGQTWSVQAAVAGDCSTFNGHIKVSADGTAYVPSSFCGTMVGGGVTTNNGGAWSSYHITGSNDGNGRGFDPSVATTPDNTVYESWADGNNYHPFVARSTSHGASWDRVTDLANTVSPPIVASTFQDTVAGDNGRLAVAFLGTQVGGGAATPYDNGFHGVWNLFVSYSYDGGLTWTTVKVTQDSDPVQRGCIWDGGGSNACRNLLDFMDASVTKDGRVVVGFSDGCINACTTEAQSTHQYGTIARQSTGKGLFAAYDSSGPSPPSAPTLTATAGNAKVDLSWTTPANNGAAISGYNVYRGGSLLASLGVINAYTDSAVTNGQTYSYQVAAVNAAGEGAKSAAKSATPTAPNTPPTACFTHTESGSGTSVNGACSSDPDGSIASYDWNWGDGSAHGTGASASHSYATGGAKTVTLTVTDNGGATGSTSQSVTVSGPPNNAPTACFSSSPVGLTASFNGGCSSDSDGTVSSYAWTFGDSASGTGATPSHTYAAAGTYTVTLTVTDNAGATGSVSHSVTVVADPDPGTPNLANGVATSATSSATSGSWQYYKIQVPAGKTQLKVDLKATQSCTLTCNPDLDLFVRQAAKPTTSAFDCSPQSGSSTETCTISSPAANYWYVGVNVFSGSKALAYTITATYS